MGGGGVILWQLDLIAKKDMSRLVITQVHAGDNHFIHSSSFHWSIRLLHPQTQDRHTDPDTEMRCNNTENLLWILLALFKQHQNHTNVKTTHFVCDVMPNYSLKYCLKKCFLESKVK